MLSRRYTRKPRPVARNCQFCASKTTPDYKDASILAKYMTERGKLMASSRSGVCSKHQRDITRAVKRARHLALLPFLVRA